MGLHSIFRDKLKISKLRTELSRELEDFNKERSEAKMIISRLGKVPRLALKDIAIKNGFSVALSQKSSLGNKQKCPL